MVVECTTTDSEEREKLVLRGAGGCFACGSTVEAIVGCVEHEASLRLEMGAELRSSHSETLVNSSVSVCARFRPNAFSLALFDK